MATITPVNIDAGPDTGTAVNKTIQSLRSQVMGLQQKLSGNYGRLTELRNQGVTTISPPMWALLALDSQNNIVPSQYALDIKAAGFKPLATEWWHFTLKDEPYPDTYFDFPMEKASLR